MTSCVAVVAAVLAAATSVYAAPLRFESLGTFNAPVYIAGMPGDANTVFVVEQEGTIRVVQNGQTLPTPLLSIGGGGGLVETGGERGLLSVAFPPDYQTSRKFYVYYTSHSGPGDIQIDEFTASSGSLLVANPGSRRPLVSVGHSDYGNHNGGQLQIGPDGMLYAGTGDGGSGGDPLHSGQSLATNLGKMLRIDPTGPALAPADNPFAGGGSDDDLIWSFGLRNPWRYSFDRENGDLWIGDVGQDTYEEVDHAPNSAGRGRGINYGWNHYEGNSLFGGGDPLNPAGTYSAPVLVYSHASGDSITGGYVSRDRNNAALYGRYLYGDLTPGSIRSFNPANPTGTDTATGLTLAGLSTFGEDACGRIYAASVYSGRVNRIAADGGCAAAGTPAPPVGSGGDGGGGGGPVAGTKLAVTLTAAKKQRAVRRGGVSFKARCNQSCEVAATGKIRVARRKYVKLPPLRLRLDANKMRTITSGLSSGKPTRLVASSIRKRKSPIASITVTAKSGSGESVKRVLRVRIVK